MALTDGNAEHSVAENFSPIQVERVCLASAPNYSPTETRSTLPVKATGTHFRSKIAPSTQLPDVASKQDCRARRDAERDREVDGGEERRLPLFRSLYRQESQVRLASLSCYLVADHFEYRCAEITQVESVTYHPCLSLALFHLLENARKVIRFDLVQR